MPKNRKNRSKDVKEAAAELPRASKRNHSDMAGGYTGTPATNGDYPEQDADDL
ncbi:MAG: hypothetical protein ACOYU3_07005 [Bacillota bacterium]